MFTEMESLIAERNRTIVCVGLADFILEHFADRCALQLTVESFVALHSLSFSVCQHQHDCGYDRQFQRLIRLVSTTKRCICTSVIRAWRAAYARSCFKPIEIAGC